MPAARREEDEDVRRCTGSNGMDGLFIECTRASADKPMQRHLLLITDTAFTYLLTLYLVILYFVIMSHTIYKNTNEFQGNNDFYVGKTGRV